MRISLITTAASALALASSLAMLSGCASAQAATTPAVATETTTSTEVAGSGLETTVAKSGNKWEQLHQGESPNVKVHWPDGHTTVGLDKHYGDLDSMFAFAPDTHVESETTRTASGEWTTVIRTVSGAFTQPLATADGKTVAPNGRPFKIWVATISHQNNGVIDEEYLFWNDKALKSQIGI